MPSMFPKLTSSSRQRSECTAVQHSVAKLRNRKTFAEDDEVTVYDNRTKLSTAGKILEVLGRNTYLVECGKGPQHISGDLISKVSALVDRDIGSNNVTQQELEEDSDRTFEEDDTISVTSSIESDIFGVADNNVNRCTRRRRRTRLDILGAADGNLQRLRPRNR